MAIKRYKVVTCDQCRKEHTMDEKTFEDRNELPTKWYRIDITRWEGCRGDSMLKHDNMFCSKKCVIAFLHGLKTTDLKSPPQKPISILTVR